MSDTLFSSLLGLEEDLIEEGRLEGIQDGERAGIHAGRLLGIQKGTEIASEMGRYLGATEVWLLLVSAQAEKGAQQEKTLALLEKLREKIINFSFDPSQEQFSDQMESIRGSYRLIRSRVLPKSTLKTEKERTERATMTF
jgi:predicted house-cleaning noncanonical NTP pyrophosphatase (MazG superfamily)